jgi:ribosome maturation factor RimP
VAGAIDPCCAEELISCAVRGASVSGGGGVSGLIEGVTAPSESAVWDLLTRVSQEEGLELFDMDMPLRDGDGGGVGVLRVFITKGRCSSDEQQERNTEEDALTGLRAAALSEGDSSDENGSSSLKTRGVSLDQCARLAKRLLDLDEHEPFIPEGCELEVSSPGVNRRLRRPEHFEGAVGERIRVKFRNDEGGIQVVTGLLKGVESGVLTVLAESGAGEVRARITAVKESRVDFRFA